MRWVRLWTHFFRTSSPTPEELTKDDFLACCFLLHFNPVEIERRDPTSEELADAKIAVVDIGHEHESEQGNFDHHQFPKEHPPTCSLSLVLQHYDLYDDAKRFCEWVDALEWLDTRGAIATSKHLNMSFEALRAFKLSNRRYPAAHVQRPREIRKGHYALGAYAHDRK